MALTMDGEGSRARYQMQTSGVQGPGRAVSNTFPCPEMEPGFSKQLQFLSETLTNEACSRRPCRLTQPSCAQLVYLGPPEYL